MSRLFLRFTVIAVLLAPLTACGNRLNVAQIEADIQADIERQGRRLALREVRCPRDVRRQAGAFFRCVGELDPEGTFTINVTQQDDRGGVAWDVPNSKVILNLVKVEEGIQRGLSQALGQQAPVDCGEAMYRANQPGDRFECRVVGGLTDGADTIQTVLVRINAAGNLDWQEQRGGHSTTVANPAPTANPATAMTTPNAATPAAPASASAPSPPVAPAVSTTGPTGRPINRPYIRGDND
ncbi:hypothetical protein GFS31_01540 [Leptolyngbya sp. BL0902]|uniref:DUF4333 domain-containing protein n=1 Tax=Leptolyngbya sp. BL0902 TaxID=1115757 RepID=UPI0018E70524|nr:DUF4333 domain-containing protein [Leptolyngbya sp. BL0902]QQE63489.1 hypothetical protein GFS31_01540 [Leptolyngbya sp. BL0902]